MKFAWWPHTRDPAIASYRLRCAQIVKVLQGRGEDAGLYAPGSAPRVLVLSKRYDAHSLGTALGLRRDHGTRLVLDLCDNHFHADHMAAGWQERAGQLRHAVRSVDLVVASTQALATVVEEEAGQPVLTQVIGDAAELPESPGPAAQWRHPLAEWRLRQFRKRLDANPVGLGRRLVWFGNHGSAYAEGGMTDLSRLRPMLEQLHVTQSLSLTVISNSHRKFLEVTQGWAVPTHYLAWHASTISRALQAHHIALIPVRLNPFTRCKTNNRVATAVLHGLAVAADTIPSYQDLGEWVVLDDWEHGLPRLMQDTAFRQRCVAQGLAHVQSSFSLDRIASHWQSALTALVQDGAVPPPIHAKP